MTDCTQIHQPRRRRENRLRTQRSVIDAISRLGDLTSFWRYTIRSRSRGKWGVPVVTWCCYNSSCPTYVRCQASAGQCPDSRRTAHPRRSTFTPHLCQISSDLKIPSKQTQQ